MLGSTCTASIQLYPFTCDWPVHIHATPKNVQASACSLQSHFKCFICLKCRLLLDAPSLCIHGSSWSHSNTVCLCLHRLYPFRPNAVWTYHQPTTLLEVSQQCEFAFPKKTFFIDFNRNDNCKYLFWVKSRSSQHKNVAGCYGSLLDCGKYVRFTAGNEFMFPQARKPWTGHSFILGSMILIPHIFWNGQALCYPVTWLIANICVNSNMKTLLLSQILQEEVCIFVL